MLSEARDRRKENRDRLDKTLTQIRELEESAVAFHRASEFDELQAGRLLSAVERVERSCGRNPALRLDNLTAVIIHHRRAITLRNLDLSKFATQGRDSDILADIADATAELEDELERQYLERYPSTFPFFSRRGFTPKDTSQGRHL